MKGLLYIFSILIVSCGQTSNQNQQPSTVESTELKMGFSDRTKDSKEIKEESIEMDSLKGLEIFKEFALSYSPTRLGAMLPEASDSVLKAIIITKTLRPEEFEKYLTLIFVKLYRTHLECCQQSYEIRRQPPGGLDKEKDPLVYEFNELTKKYSDKKRIEFISSSIGYDYVMSNKYLLDFEPIKKHIEIIEKVHKNIEDGIY